MECKYKRQIFKLFLIQNSLKFNGVIVVIVVEMQVEYYRSNPQQGDIPLGLLMTTQCTKDIIHKCFKIRIIIQF